ncbi:histidine phosphatase family protein [Thalassobacillus sp. CUG 92003]|uniref:histidine phosphatase family protein n=1 Tax=Thalassobacillus sp. CUG 92003 TaxID=2736641 RepID=UPI0015E6B790|nr:histidine phosphatase family protein [Thalassobacillus sp. CUG 92003]
MTNLYFVRHAHSIYSPDELGRPLSEDGFNDAAKVTRLFNSEQINHVVSSPYKRAIQTVEGIAKQINKDITIVDGFKERTLSKDPVKDFPSAITKVWEDYNFSWEGGESNLEAQKRGVAATLNILEKFRGKNVVIGTHGNIMVLIMNFFNERYNFTFWKELEMPDVYKLTFDDKALLSVKRIWGKETYE